LFAIAFDLTIAEVERLHPRSVAAAYSEIGRVLSGYGFAWAQGSVYIAKHEDLANVYEAITALRTLPWLPQSVRDIRVFRVEQWSDFTSIVKRGLEDKL
jgi:virulence-associated protein VapD